MDKLPCSMFGGNEAHQYNALMSALMNCAKSEGKEIYNWLESTPKTTLVALLVDEINLLGYEIKIKPPSNQ